MSGVEVGETAEGMVRSASQEVPELGQLDVRLERAYLALGPSVLLAFAAAGWVLLLVFGGAAIATFVRLEQLSATTGIELFAVQLPIWVLGVTVGHVVLRRRMRPVLAFWAESPGADALTAWQSARRLPLEVIRINCTVGALLCLPLSIVAGASVVSFDLPLVIVLVVCVAATLLMLAGGGMFGAQLVCRPVIRDLSRRLETTPPSDHGVPVVVKLRLAVAGTAAASALAVFASATPGVEHWDLLGGMLVALTIASLPALLVAWLLGVSLLAPLRDLLAATHRLRAGRFDTPVPDLSADEYGVLARSFNEAMSGLEDRARLAVEVRASRARIVAASDAERRRIERNIHDGAQQRLVALALDLRMLADRATDDQATDLRQMADDAAANLNSALDELRELARGLHPSVLTTDGLSPALRQLAAVAPLPVSVDAPDERYPETVESTAYYVVCEALANVAKHAAASRAEVSVARSNGRLVVCVSDDGVGGADIAAGTGLAGLADRVAAIEGTLTVKNDPVGGARVTAELPVIADTVLAPGAATA